MTEPLLRIIPLGGVGEIGRNSTLIEYGDDILIIDAGLMFPRYDMPGIDLVIADYSYLEEKGHKVRGIVITHGHEDHAGGLPYLLRYTRAPIHATELTLGLVQVKLRENKLLSDVTLHTIVPGQPFEIGCFRLEPFRVCHSIPDGIGLGIETPIGLVVHSGDFKFDPHPVDGKTTDFAKLTELGERGALVLLSDSTNAETVGSTPSEQTVAQLFEEVFSTAPGRIIVATFASNISRVQQVIAAAEKAGRRIGIVGHSMVNNVKMALSLGYLTEPSSPFLSIEDVERLSPEKVALICTGSQGEPTSALVRMSNGGYRQISVRPDDTVIISATPIPGNEEVVNQTVDNLFRLGANVFYDELKNVHVSGHGAQDELRQMLRLIRPQYFVPIHGEYRHLVLHARLAEEAGIPKGSIFIVESGQSIEFTAKTGRLGRRVAEGYVYVDGLGVGDIGKPELRDRYILSQDGFLIVTVLIDELTEELLLGPHLASRGFVDEGDSDAILQMARGRIVEALAAAGGSNAGVSTIIKETLGNYLYMQTRRRPMIVPVVMKI